MPTNQKVESLSQFVTILNWTAVVFLAYFILRAKVFFDPSKGADTSSAGNFWVAVAFVDLVVIATFNLLPFGWARYVALTIVLLPFAIFWLDDLIIILKRLTNYSRADYDGSRYFSDPQRKAIAKAISFQEVDKLGKLLQKPVPLINDFQNTGRLTLLNYTARIYSSYNRDWETTKRMMELLIAAGATINSNDPQRLSTHAGVIGNYPSTMLQFFLDRGADPHAKGSYKMRLLFEAILTSTEPAEKVQLLLDHGASLNETDTFDVETEQYSPLLFAAHIKRWPVCLLLIQHGADIHFKAPNGFKLGDYLKKQEAQYIARKEMPSPEFNAVNDLVFK